MEQNEKLNELQRKLHEADQKVKESLKQFFDDDQIQLIMHQLNITYNLISKTEMRYQYSKDFRDAIDIIMGLIIGGKFILTEPKIPIEKDNKN